VRPPGHLQVERGAGRRWHALWRDADGRHQRVLGPARVKESGKPIARRGVWHTANGPNPDVSYLTPADAAAEHPQRRSARVDDHTAAGRPVV
jgi:hypothetical protein